MATLSVKSEKRGDEVVWRIYAGKKPLGSDQIPARPTDGGGFATKAEAEALRSQLMRRIEEKKSNVAS